MQKSTEYKQQSKSNTVLIQKNKKVTKKGKKHETYTS